MTRLVLRTAGESHGLGILAWLEGIPFGLELDREEIDRLLALRQKGFGRSSRQRIERDRVEVLAGLVGGRTNGAPLVLFVANRDRSLERQPPVRRPRPGHADLAGALRHAEPDARAVLERASARETAGRVAAGAVAKQLLRRLGVEVEGFVCAIGGEAARSQRLSWNRRLALRDANDLRVPDPEAAERIRRRIREAGRAGDTLGGVVEVRARGVPAGLGSLASWEERLDGRLVQALVSIPSAKGAEIGGGFEQAARPGSEVHDPILPGRGRPRRPTNRAGGIEGGLTNGEEVVVRVAFKPIPTLGRPLPSVDLETGRPAEAERPRSDVCAVPAASVVAEAMVAWVLAEAALARYAGPTIDDVVRNRRAQDALRRRRLFRNADGGARRGRKGS